MLDEKIEQVGRSLQVKVRVMVFNATFNNISVLLLRSVLLVEETEENH
jgi:energy-converting hydrogenase Eha subunit E